MNKVILHGRMTRDPEAQIYGEKKKVSFAVAVQRRGKNAPADFINCQSWDKTADLVELYFPKGKEIVLEGQIRVDKYTNKEGKQTTYTYVLVDNVEFAGAKEEAAPKPEPKPEPKLAPKQEQDEFLNVELESLDAELPFI